MKRISIMILLLLGAVVLISSCRKDDNRIYYQVGDQNFVTDASSSTLFEVQAGKLAMTRGVSDSVKKFAGTMISNNNDLSGKLSAVASQNGFTMSTTLQPVDQNNLNALNTLTGVAFDKQYAAIMVTAHQGTLSLFGAAGAVNGVGNANLRAFANGQIAGLQTQLVLSQKLVLAISGESGQ